MVKEPLESVAPDDIRCWLNENYNEYNLAVAFADTHNKVGWLMHDSDEDYAVSVLVDKWYECYIQLFNMILKILTDENRLKKTNHRLEGGTNYIAKPFMERNGYYDGGGWWIKEIDV